jgi:hypothetical protein
MSDGTTRNHRGQAVTRLYLLAFLVLASGCMEGAFPWARRQPPPFAQQVVKQGMEESSRTEDKSAKTADEPPKTQTAAKAPEVSPLSWVLEDMRNSRGAAGQAPPDQLPPSLLSH